MIGNKIEQGTTKNEKIFQQKVLKQKFVEENGKEGTVVFVIEKFFFCQKLVFT